MLCRKKSQCNRAVWNYPKIFVHRIVFFSISLASRCCCKHSGNALVANVATMFHATFFCHFHQWFVTISFRCIVCYIYMQRKYNRKQTLKVFGINLLCEKKRRTCGSMAQQNRWIHWDCAKIYGTGITISIVYFNRRFLFFFSPFC